MKTIDLMEIPYDKELCYQMKGKYPIDSYLFFKMFGVGEVHAVDYVNSDGADIIIDLNKELPEYLYEKFDYIIDGGTLEHIFNVGTAIKDSSLMLKKGGVVIHILPLGGYVNHGFYSFSPTFFLDYYSINGYTVHLLDMEFMLGKTDYDNYDKLMAIYSQDCRLFKQNGQDWANISLNQYIKQINSLDGVWHAYIWCIAEKKGVSCCAIPIQGIYRKRDN